MKGLRRGALAASAAGLFVVLSSSSARAQDEPPLAPLPAAPEARPDPAPAAPSPSPEPAAPVREAPPPYVAVPAPAPPARFGSRGQVLVTSAATLAVASVSYSDSSASSFAISIAPGIDYFAVRYFSIGGDVELGYESRTGGAGVSFRKLATTRYGAALRLGLALPLSSAVTFYPRVSLGARARRVDEESGAIGATPTPTDTTFVGHVTFYAPLVLEVAPHLVVGFGPGVTQEIGETTFTTVFGQLMVGTFWGGEARPDAAALPADTRIVRGPRMGDAHHVVITGESRINLAYSHLNGGSSNNSGSVIAVQPGLDVFVVDHLSLGGELVLRTSYQSGVRDTRLGIGPRVGYEIPLGDHASLYPQLGVQVARAIVDDSSPGGGAQSRFLAVTAGLHAPVLFHVASHGFLGFGPYVNQALIRSYDHGTSGNLSTEVGASFLIGGWL